MAARSEVRVFYAVIGGLLLIPTAAGLAGAFGGLSGMATLFGVSGEYNVHPVVANNFRAVSFAFFSWVPLIIWSLRSFSERAAVFRIVVGCAFLTGFARMTGWLLEGYPGILPATLMALELGAMPLLLLWHARLLRLSQANDAERRAGGHS